MFTRLLTFKGTTDIDGGVRYLREEVLPVLHAQRGYQGITASGDCGFGAARASGDHAGTTLRKSI